ncbi:hypothetical protein, partial [Klebsiella pneumoniae]|uniref:hypothetical protein n=1 Tax=Klebsiella pneumoniae TaxID=573 RepID=UPI003F02A1CA
GQVENMSVEGLFVHGGDLWRLNTPLSCLQPPQQGKTHIYTGTISDATLSLCKSCFRVNAMNVHKSYQTITHYHFDWLTPAGDYPKSAIMVVECKDGRWMIVQEFGEDYGCFEGVLKNESDLITKPTFYPGLRSAAISGFGMMKQLYPLYDDNLFNEFLLEISE